MAGKCGVRVMRQESRQAAGEDQRLVDFGQKERFDTETIARQKQAVVAEIVDSEREHSM